MQEKYNVRGKILKQKKQRFFKQNKKIFFLKKIAIKNSENLITKGFLPLLMVKDEFSIPIFGCDNAIISLYDRGCIYYRKNGKNKSLASVRKSEKEIPFFYNARVDDLQR